MEKLWGLDNFSAGMHTQPAKVEEGGDNYAFSVEGLIADKEGYLVLAPELREVVGGTDDLTGTAEAAGHIIYLRAGVPSIESTAVLGFDTALTLPHTNFLLSGRVTAIAPRSSDYLIWTTEGNDTGFWTDLRAGENFATYFLGIPPPLLGPTLNPHNYPLPAFGTPHPYRYLYRYAYVREFFDDPSEPFHGVQSNASDISDRRILDELGTVSDRGIEVSALSPVSYTHLTLPTKRIV